MRLEKYDTISKLLCTRHTFILSGYIPAREAASLEAELSGKFEVAVELSEPDDEEDVPVLLRNNSFAEPVEGVLESYGLPQKGEIDPTPVMAIFYYSCSGMLSDFATARSCSPHGVAVGKSKNMEIACAK
jgi:V/A-type H+-transporting ATPase subunit I